MILVRAMAHVEAEGVRARKKQLADHLRAAAGRTKCDENANLACAWRESFHIAFPALYDDGYIAILWRTTPPRRGATKKVLTMNEPKINDTAAATAFRRLVSHLQHRTDAQNVDLMGLAEADDTLSKDAAREAIYGMPYAEWKKAHQSEASPEQLKRMEESVARNRASH